MKQTETQTIELKAWNPEGELGLHLARTPTGTGMSPLRCATYFFPFKLARNATKSRISSFFRR